MYRALVSSHQIFATQFLIDNIITRVGKNYITHDQQADINIAGIGGTKINKLTDKNNIIVFGHNLRYDNQHILRWP